MILRLLLIILAIWAGYTIVKFVRRIAQQKSVKKVESTQMVKCDYCGIHVSTHAAIHSDAGVYCCTEHLEQDKNS